MLFILWSLSPYTVIRDRKTSVGATGQSDNAEGEQYSISTCVVLSDSDGPTLQLMCKREERVLTAMQKLQQAK